MVHFILLLAFAIATIKIRYKEKHNAALVISFIILFVFAALRYNYGNDYWPYSRIYYEAQKGFNVQGVEPLYYEINKWFPSYQVLIATLSLFYLCVVYKLIVKYVDEKYTWLSVMIFLINPYLFLMSLSSIRQILVVSLFILSLMVSPANKWAKMILFVVTVGVSFFIHKTAILLLPFYFVYYEKKNIKRDYLMFGLTPVVLVLSSDILWYLIGKVMQLFGNNKNFMAYLESGASNSLRATLLSAVIYIFVLMNLKHLDEKTYPLARFYLFGLMFAILAYRISMMTRFQMYFDIFGIVALPAVIKAKWDTNQLTPMQQLLHRYLLPTVILAIFILRYYSFFTNDLWSSFAEYQTIIFK